MIAMIPTKSKEEHRWLWIAPSHKGLVYHHPGDIRRSMNKRAMSCVYVFMTLSYDRPKTEMTTRKQAICRPKKKRLTSPAAAASLVLRLGALFSEAIDPNLLFPSDSDAIVARSLPLLLSGALPASLASGV
jgi:hypothetical protein